MRQFVRIQTAQTHGIEEFTIAARKQTWIAIDAGDQSATVPRYRESEKQIFSISRITNI